MEVLGGISPRLALGLEPFEGWRGGSGFCHFGMDWMDFWKSESVGVGW